MRNQNLFEALERICGFTALETDMAEIISAYEKDMQEHVPILPTPKPIDPSICKHVFIWANKDKEQCHFCGLTQSR